MSEYRPTRMCPHRFCRPVHMALGVVGVALIAEMAFQSLVGIIFIAALGVIGAAVARMIHQKSLHEQVMEEEIDRAADTVLMVRPGWATVAIGLDLLFLVGSCLSVSLLFTGGSDVAMPTPDAAGYLALTLAISLPAFCQYAHRQATRPARPKRVLTPAGN